LMISILELCFSFSPRPSFLCSAVLDHGRLLIGRSDDGRDSSEELTVLG